MLKFCLLFSFFIFNISSFKFYKNIIKNKMIKYKMDDGEIEWEQFSDNYNQELKYNNWYKEQEPKYIEEKQYKGQERKEYKEQEQQKTKYNEYNKSDIFNEIINKKIFNTDAFINEFINFLHDDIIHNSLKSTHLYFIILLIINNKEKFFKNKENKENNNNNNNNNNVDKKYTKLKTMTSILFLLFTIIFIKNVDIAE